MKVRTISKHFLVMLAFSVLGVSCYYDNEEELYLTNCNVTTVGFAADILPLVNDKCIVCHSDAALLGGISLSTYDKIKVQINNGKFIGSVRHDSGYSPMPQGQAKISKCDIEKVEKWIAEGAINN
jgi:hypothetical protein